MKRILFFICVLIIGSMIFSGSLYASESKYGGTITIAQATPPSDFDPLSANDDSSRQVFVNIYEGLIVHNENMEIIPMLAKSWDISDDGKTYTFYLRKGVNFQKGYGEMTAEDVIASINRAIERLADKSGLDEIAEMNAKDKYTVTIKLKNSSPIFLNRLAIERLRVAIMPKKVIEGVPLRGLTDDQIIGTGPYQLAKWEKDQYVLLERFEDYTPVGEETPGSYLGGHKFAYADQLKYIKITESSSRVAGLKTGEIDFAYALSKDMYDEIVNDPNIDPVIAESGRFSTVVFNTVNGIMTDRELRRAVQVGINCEGMLKASTAGRKEFYELNGSQYRKFSVWYSEAGLEYYNESDIEKAKQMVEDLGYKGEKVNIVTTTGTMMETEAVMLYDTLEKMGLDPQLQLVDWPTNLDKFFRDWTGWDISFTGNTSIRTDPLMQYSQYNGTWSYQSDEMDRIFQKLATTMDHEERLELNKEFLEFLMKDIPVYYVGLTFSLLAKSSSLKGFTPYPNMGFWNAWKE